MNPDFAVHGLNPDFAVNENEKRDVYDYMHTCLSSQQIEDPVQFLPTAVRTITATGTALSASPQKCRGCQGWS